MSAGAGTGPIPQKAKRGEGGAAVGTDQTRAGFPLPGSGAAPGAPDTPTAPAARASPPGRPEGTGEAGSGRAESGPRGRAVGGVRRGRLCSPGGPSPGVASAAALPGPRVVPGAGQPRARRMEVAAAAPRPSCEGAPAAPGFRVRLRGRPAAGARRALPEFAIRRAGIRAPSVLPSLPHVRPPHHLSRSCRPLAAAWEAPALNPPARPRGLMSAADPCASREHHSLGGQSRPKKQGGARREWKEQWPGLAK